jgi:hypothetical protein
VDAGNTFWFYSTAFCSLLYYHRRKDIYFLIAMISCAVALSFKLSWFSILPLLYVLIRLKKGAGYWLFSLSGIFLFFILANGGRYTAGNFILTLNNVMNDNINVIEQHAKYLNPLVYVFELMAGLGLPVFFLSAYGAVRIFTKEKDPNNFSQGEFLVFIATPIFLHFLSICLLDIPFTRQILPMIPAAVLIAAYGVTEIGLLKLFLHRNIRYVLFVFILLYQLIYVASNEYYFVFDTRKTAGEWLEKNVSKAVEVTTTRFVIIPYLNNNYRTADNFESPYIILHEANYFRYIRSAFNPVKDYPTWEETFHGKYADFLNIQKLFRGELPYILAKKFEVKAVTPEMILYKGLWGSYHTYIGDLLIYKKIDGY